MATLDEPLEAFKVRIAARLDAHFEKFKPTLNAINVGMSKKVMQ